MSHVSHIIRASGRNGEEDDLIVRVASCAYDLSLPNQLIANQSAHALRLGSILFWQKIRMR